MTGSETAGQIQAVLHIQWLSMKNSLRRRSERLGLVATVLVGLVWYGLWTAGAAGLFALSLWASSAQLNRALPTVLFFSLLWWQLSPLLTASMGVSIDLRKMSLYPVNVRSLFVIECLLRLLTALEMILLLAGLSLGMAVRSPRHVPLFLPAAALFLLFNILLSAGLRNLLERLLRRRGFREALLFLILMASVAPQLVLWSGSGERIGRRIYHAFRFLPQSFLPSTSLAHAYLGDTTAGDWAVLLASSAAAAVFGCWQFRRSYRYQDVTLSRPEPLRPAAQGETWVDRLYRLPARLFPDPAAALVEKELRYLARSPRFRFLFLMGCSFGVVAWLPFAMRGSSGPGRVLHSSFLAVLSLYALLLLGQATLLNCFGLDRSAARYFFWMPLSPLTLLVAKNLAAAVALVLEILVLAVICLLLRVSGGVGPLLEALAVAGISGLYLASVGNISSVLFAKGISPERVSRRGPGGVEGLMVFVYPLLISPVLAAYFARYYWHTMRGFVFLLAIAAAGGLALYAATLPLAARLGYRRREKLLEGLSRGEGPLVTE